MNYKTINKGMDCLYKDNLLEVLLKQRGVQDVDKLLHLDKTCVYDGMRFDYMKEGLELFKRHIDNESNILIIVDSDFDGYSSAATIYNYLKDNNLSNNLQYVINKEKKHGIILDSIKDYDYDLLIVPDAGSSDLEAQNILNKEGKDILILDHHNYDYLPHNDEKTILINCQDRVYPNNTLSGVGVVYKFIKEYDKMLGISKADDYLDLVALGMVADDMDLRNLETRYLVLEGINKINNKNKINQFIEEMLNKAKIENLNILDIGWKIAPLINAVVRVGTLEEQNDVFNAFINVKDDREYQPRRKKGEKEKPPKEIHSLQKYMAREIVNIKSRQDRAVKKGVDIINNIIQEQHLNDNKIIIVDGTDILDKTFTGLVANKLTSTYKRPALILKSKDNNTFGGSGRNYNLSPIENLQSFLLQLKTFNWIQGHDNAFGLNINKDKIESTNNLVNTQLKDVEIEDCHWVDYEIPVGRLKPKHILDIGKWKDVWGNSLQEPQFAITDIYVKSEDIQLVGERKNVIRITKKVGDKVLTFIKFFANEELYNQMVMKSSKGLGKSPSKLKLDIIGKFEINEWEGKEYPQISIVDFNVTKGKKIQF